jgi:hypothetical protein
MKYFFAVLAEYPWTAFCVAIFIMILIDKATVYLNLLIIFYQKKVEHLDKLIEFEKLNQPESLTKK